MDEKLVPAHILFTKWFIRIRWVAFFILVGSNYCVRHLFHITVVEGAIYILAFVLFALNVIHYIILRTLVEEEEIKLSGT